jgi:hypothetical protein
MEPSGIEYRPVSLASNAFVIKSISLCTLN